MIMDVLKHLGTTAWLRDRLKMSVRTSVNTSAHSLSTQPGMLSGPATFRGLTLARVLNVCSESMVGAGWSLTTRGPGLHLM